jgi:hypothetical protein
MSRPPNSRYQHRNCSAAEARWGSTNIMEDDSFDVRPRAKSGRV